MRHDVAFRPKNECSIARFESDLELLVHACRTIADYAAQYGITTSVENHGFFVQASDRVQRLIEAVGRANYKTTMDIGNFMCVDEDPVAAVKKESALRFHDPFERFFTFARPITTPEKAGSRQLAAII